MINALNTPSLNLIHFYPTGATAADLAATLPTYAQLTGSLPPTIYYLVSGRQGNFNNVSTQGIDMSFDYVLPTDSWGTFQFGGALTEFLRFKQLDPPGRAVFSRHLSQIVVHQPFEPFLLTALGLRLKLLFQHIVREVVQRPLAGEDGFSLLAVPALPDAMCPGVPDWVVSLTD